MRWEQSRGVSADGPRQTKTLTLNIGQIYFIVRMMQRPAQYFFHLVPDISSSGILIVYYQDYSSWGPTAHDPQFLGLKISQEKTNWGKNQLHGPYGKNYIRMSAVSRKLLSALKISLSTVAIQT